MKSALIIVRTEADFERAVAIGITGKEKYRLYFVFIGDFSPFYNDGIQNKFQKKLFESNGFRMYDFSEFDSIGRLLRKLSKERVITYTKVRERREKILTFVFFMFFNKYIKKHKKRIIKKIFNKIKPSFILTDQSMTNEDYLPEQVRAEAIYRNIPVFIFTHGAAGGLHSVFSSPVYEDYNGCTVFVANKNETSPAVTNRIVLGDISSGYPYVKFLNSQNYEEINFLNHKKYKIGFMIGGTAAYTSTSGWLTQEEIIIELSDNKDVAMIIKVHPRDENLNYLKMVNKFDNVLVVGNETDRSRVTNWADIVVCNDHCSTIFEPMILGKKVVAIEGRHIPKYKNNHSPLKYSSVKNISSSRDFHLNSIPNADPEDPVTNEIAWGGNGNVDLVKLMFLKIEKISGQNQLLCSTNGYGRFIPQ